MFDPLAFVVLVPAVMFLIIPFGIARFGGWSALAREYRFQGRFDGPRWWFQELTLRGWCGYNGCVSVGANAEGLYLNTIFPVSHPPLLIPWRELSVACREVRFLGFRLGKIEFATQRVPHVHIALRESLLKKIAAAQISVEPLSR